MTFKFKEKGRKPVDAKGVLQLMIMGADMDVEKMALVLQSQGLVEME